MNNLAHRTKPNHHNIHIIIIDLKRQNCLKVGTDKPKLKVKMQSVSDVWKRLVEKPRFELVVEGVFRPAGVFQVFAQQPGTGKAPLALNRRLIAFTS